MPLIYLDQIADKKLKASSTEDATTNIYADSTASIRTAGGMSVEKRLMVGQFYGRVPLGGIIAISGGYGATNNSGAFTIAPGVPATGVVSDDGFMRCDGALITDVLSPFEGMYLPKIDDDRFLQGSAFASVGTKSAPSGANLGNNTVSLNNPIYMPSHNHGGFTGSNSISLGGSGYVASALAGVEGNAAGDLNHLFRTNNAAADARSPLPNTGSFNGWNTLGSSLSGSSSHTHSISPQGNATPFDIRPVWLGVYYLIRVI